MNDAAIMFPSMAEQEPPGKGPGFLTNPPNPDPGTAGTESQAAEPASPAEMMYREGGDPPADGNYGDALGGFFDQREREARYNQQAELVGELAEARQAVQEALASYQIGKTGAQELLCLADDYGRSPRSAEALEVLTASCREEFEKTYGEQLPHVMAGAWRVFTELQAKIPSISEYVEAGMGSDPRFIRALIQAAKTRGYVQKGKKQ
ncbi:MAG: hypothetical protein R2940_16265 [Syntrophotaleaceae bacterium]